MCKTVGPNIVLLKGTTWQSSYDAYSHDNTYLYSRTLSVMSPTKNHQSQHKVHLDVDMFSTITHKII